MVCQHSGVQLLSHSLARTAKRLCAFKGPCKLRKTIDSDLDARKRGSFSPLWLWTQPKAHGRITKGVLAGWSHRKPSDCSESGLAVDTGYITIAREAVTSGLRELRSGLRRLGFRSVRVQINLSYRLNMLHELSAFSSRVT